MHSEELLLLYSSHVSRKNKGVTVYLSGVSRVWVGRRLPPSPLQAPASAGAVVL